MGIRYDEQSAGFILDTENTTYAIGIADEEGFVGHAYYGHKLSELDTSYLMRVKNSDTVPSRNNRDRCGFLNAFPAEFPGNHAGDYREPAIEVLDGNGHRGVCFFYKSHAIFAGKKKLPGLPATFGSKEECETLELMLEDPVLKLQAVLSYTVFPKGDVITRSVRVVNQAANPIYLTRIFSMSMDMDQSDYQLLTLHGSWARERQLEFRDIAYGKQSVGSIRGKSSHQENPFMALVSANATQETGEVYAFNFVYSGDFLAQVEKSQFGQLRLSMGIHPQNFCFKLEAGESFYAPEVVMTYSDQGLGKMTRSFHDVYRDHLIRSKYVKSSRPVLINNWEATYFDFDTQKLLDIARSAKAAGIEMLVMDDGWFGHRVDDNSSLGDWYVNEQKLPGGVKYLAEEIHKLGLKFGIWFEPEMISEDSDVYRAHPDWAIAIPGRKPCPSRNQYMLDLSNPEVREYAYECVAKILREAPVDYVKWDMNREMTDLGSAFLDSDRQGELSHRQCLAVYEMQERLITEFPDLLLENCSGGGGRFDPGMLYYSPQIWCSDDADAVERLKIQEGTALVYPLSTMGAHVAVCPNHTVGRVTPFETRGHVALAGTFGYELDVTKLSKEEYDQIPTQIELYHKYELLIRSGDYYRIASYAQNHLYDCYEVVAKDQSEALITFVQVMNEPNMLSYRIKLPGLAPDRSYRVEETGEVFRGDTLQYGGLLLTRMWGDCKSRLIHLVAE